MLTLDALHPLVKAVAQRAREQAEQWDLLTADEQQQIAGMEGRKVADWLAATESTEDAARRLAKAMEEGE